MNYLVSEPNYKFVTANLLPESLLSIEMRKTEAVIYKPVYLGQLILDISKITMYEF